MSWLRPDNIQPSDYSPEKKFSGMVERLGKRGEQIARIFNEVDPLHCFYGDNVDEYVGYVERFFSSLGDRDFTTLDEHEMATLVRGSFYPSQITDGFLDEKDLELLTQRVIQSRASWPK